MKRMLLLFALVTGLAIAMPASAAPVPSAGQSAAAAGAKTPEAKPSDLLTSSQARRLIAKASTPADHIKLQKHYLALAARYDATAAEHTADAEAYRKNPTFLDSKHPGGPGTAAHCDRFAELAREAAKEARELATAHEHMAAGK